jgi:hypothetical protein
MLFPQQYASPALKTTHSQVLNSYKYVFRDLSYITTRNFSQLSKSRTCADSPDQKSPQVDRAVSIRIIGSVFHHDLTRTSIAASPGDGLKRRYFNVSSFDL